MIAGIQLPGVVTAADFILPAHAQVEAVAAGLPADWAATVWLLHGCGLRIGEALAVNLRCRINGGKTLRARGQVNPAAELRPLKFRREGEFRDIPLPQYVSEAIDKHVAEHGTTSDAYLFQGRKYRLVMRRHRPMLSGEVPDTGSLRGDVLEVLRRVSARFADLSPETF